MEKKQSTAQQWLETATKGIRFKPDRLAAEAELREHLEDKTADMARIFHIEGEEAEREALKRMGDPEEIGKKLAQIHKPWLGYLWTASRLAVFFALVITLLLGAPRLTELPVIWDDWTDGFAADYIDRWVTGGNLEDFDVILTPVKLLHPHETAKVGHYRFRVNRAALWTSPLDPEYRLLAFELKTTGVFPWEPVDWYVPRQIRGVDDLGNPYQSTAEYRLEHQWESEDRYIYCSSGSTGPARQVFLLEVRGLDPGAKRLCLEYDWGGGRWSMTIGLEEQG